MKRVLKWGAIGLGGLIVLLVIIAVVAPEPGEEPKMTVSAYDLLRDYEDNEVAADLKYKDKVVLVTGVIDSIYSGDVPTVTFSTPGVMEKALLVDNPKGISEEVVLALQWVTCRFSPEEVVSVGELRKGQQITFRGKVTGDGLFGVGVEVNGCSVWESP